MDKENGVDLVSDDENEDDGDENAYHIFDEYVANFIDGNKKEGEFKICNSSLFACLYTFFFVNHGNFEIDFTILPPPLSRCVKSLVDVCLYKLADHFMRWKILERMLMQNTELNLDISYPVYPYTIRIAGNALLSHLFSLLLVIPD